MNKLLPIKSDLKALLIAAAVLVIVFTPIVLYKYEQGEQYAEMEVTE